MVCLVEVPGARVSSTGRFNGSFLALVRLLISVAAFFWYPLLHSRVGPRIREVCFLSCEILFFVFVKGRTRTRRCGLCVHRECESGVAFAKMSEAIEDHMSLFYVFARWWSHSQNYGRVRVWLNSGQSSLCFANARLLPRSRWRHF